MGGTWTGQLGGFDNACTPLTQGVEEVYDNFLKVISLLPMIRGERNIFPNFFVQFKTTKKKKKGIYRDDTPSIIGIMTQFLTTAWHISILKNYTCSHNRRIHPN